MSFHSQHGRGKDTRQVMLPLKVLCPVMAQITCTYIPLVKASSWSHPTLQNKEVSSIIWPKRGGIRIPVNRPNNNHNPSAALFLYRAVCPSLPASLKMPACFKAYGKFTWKRLQTDIRQDFLMPSVRYQQGFRSIFSGFFRSRTQAYSNPCLQENTRVECELSVWVFPCWDL